MTVTYTPEIKKLEQIVDSLNKKYIKEPNGDIGSVKVGLELLIRQLNVVTNE